MKLIILTAIISLLNFGNALAQRIHITDTTNSWRCRLTGGGDCGYEVVGNYNYQGDTVISNKNYRRLVGTDIVLHTESMQGCFNYYAKSGTYFIREDTLAGKVWITGRNATGEAMAFNKGWVLGDTVILAFNTKSVIVNIDSVEINNLWYTVFHFRGVQSNYKNVIIEGIGGVEGPAFPVVADCHLECAIKLLCFYNNNSQPQLSSIVNDSFGHSFSNAGPCNLGIEIAAMNVLTAKVYPNPVNSFSGVRLSENIRSGRLSVYNSSGLRVYEAIIQNATFVPIPVSISASGVYLLRVEDDGGRFYSGKFIVE